MGILAHNPPKCRRSYRLRTPMNHVTTIVLKTSLNLPIFYMNKATISAPRGEYHRYLFYEPQESEEIRYKIAICYRFGG